MGNFTNVREAPGIEEQLVVLSVTEIPWHPTQAKTAAAEFTPFARRMIVLTLALGALFLAANAAWLFAGMYRYQDFVRP